MEKKASETSADKKRKQKRLVERKRNAEKFEAERKAKMKAAPRVITVGPKGSKKGQEDDNDGLPWFMEEGKGVPPRKRAFDLPSPDDDAPLPAKEEKPPGKGAKGSSKVAPESKR